MSENGHKVRVVLKYCGSCNPQVDLNRIVRHLAQMAERRGDFVLVPFSDEDKADVLVIFCGCPRACADKKEVREKAKQSLLIAAESIDRRPVPEGDLPSALEQELDKILKQQK